MELPQRYASLYPEIKRIAHARLMQLGRPDTLDTTALAHEGFLRLAEKIGLEGGSPGHFLAYVGKVLRSIVIDHHRSLGAGKRGGAYLWVTLSEAENVAAEAGGALPLEALDAAMARLAELDPPLAETLEMSAFMGLESRRIASLRDCSERTVQRDLTKARALLARLLETGTAT